MGDPTPPADVANQQMNATQPVVINPNAHMAPSHRKVSKTQILIACSLLLIALLSGAAFLILGQSNSSYQNSAKDLFSVVMNDNLVIKSKVETLNAGSTSSSLQTSVVVAITDTQVVLTRLATLPNSSPSTESDLRNALVAESTWLHTLLGVLKQPSVAPAIPLSIARDSVVSAFSRVPFLGAAQFPAVTSMDQWSVQNLGDMQFNYQVVAILQQSSTILPTLNYFYSQLREAALYGDASISLDEAETDIQTIISSRQAMLSRTQSLTASNPQTANIQSLLESAFNASLKDDMDLYTCLNQYSNGWSTYIAQSCLDASQPDNAAASNAKNAFKVAYNALRSQLGLPAYNGSF